MKLIESLITTLSIRKLDKYKIYGLVNYSVSKHMSLIYKKVFKILFSVLLFAWKKIKIET